MTIDKRALRERYSPKPVPKCHICGEEMTIQRMSASRITYGCTGEGDDGYFKFGRTFTDEHYENSRVTVVDVSDPDVLALLDENLQLQREKDAIEAVALALRDDMRQVREQLEEAKKQVEELTMWIKRLAHSLRNARPNSKLHSAAMNYLSRKGLISVEDVLR